MVPAITVLPAAGKFMRRLVRMGGDAAAGFRLHVTPGGCSGLASEFSVEPAPHAGDTVLELDGLRLFLTAASAALLDGVSIDFADTPRESGLTFVRAGEAACACGTAAPPATASVPLAALKRR